MIANEINQNKKPERLPKWIIDIIKANKYNRHPKYLSSCSFLVTLFKPVFDEVLYKDRLPINSKEKIPVIIFFKRTTKPLKKAEPCSIKLKLKTLKIYMLMNHRPLLVVEE